jgi:hypothetical protein
MPSGQPLCCRVRNSSIRGSGHQARLRLPPKAAPDPVVRLWVANAYVEDRLSGRREGVPVWQGMEAILAEYDRWQEKAGGGPGVRVVLATSLRLVTGGRAAADGIADRHARQHFVRLLDMLALQFQRRLDTGARFATAMSLTDEGEPLHERVDVREAVNLVTLLTGEELDALVRDTAPIEPSRPPASLEGWSRQLPFLLLYRADADDRRAWLTEYYRIA